MGGNPKEGEFKTLLFTAAMASYSLLQDVEQQARIV